MFYDLEMTLNFFFLLAHSFWLSLTMRESLETADLHTEHRPPFLSPSLIKTVSSCVVQIVCVTTNQGSSNPNCLKLHMANKLRSES